MKVLLSILILLLSTLEVRAGCVGKFVNPVTDICWSCIFPISIGPARVNAGGRRDTENTNTPVCFCPETRAGLTKLLPGIPIGFWEPVRLVEVTRTPYCLMSIGGVKLGSDTLKQGTVANKSTRASGKRSFYHVHWYMYPLIYWLELLTDFVCMEKASFDLAYLTEFDPLWNDDVRSFILNPEAILFTNPLVQAACAADCVSATADFPSDSLYWCAGCHGSLYPFTGTVTTHYSGVQASQLVAEKFIAKLHRQLILWETSGTKRETICDKSPCPKIKKTQYKLQMLYPKASTKGDEACTVLGYTTVTTEQGKEFPYAGEDWSYLVWRKRNCCLL